MAITLFFIVELFAASGIVLTHGTPDNGEGCYFHNNGVSITVGESYWREGHGVNNLKMQPGGSINLHVNTIAVESSARNAFATHEWESSQSDNSKFTFDPQIVHDNSPEDLSGTTETIAASYTATSQETLQNGQYQIELVAQGAHLYFWVSVEGTAIPEFDNAALILTFSVIMIVAAFSIVRSRKCLPEKCDWHAGARF